MRAYYETNGVTLYHGDCRDILPGLSPVDMVLTDPPYGIDVNNGDLAHRHMIERAAKCLPVVSRAIMNDGREVAQDLYAFLFDQVQRLLPPGGVCVVFAGGGGTDPQWARTTLALIDSGLELKQTLVWDKGYPGLGYHYRSSYEAVLVGFQPGVPCRWERREESGVSNVVRFPKILPDEDSHPTPKPQALMGFFIELHSAPGEVVLDPFCGHGPTLLAARALGRRAVGVELDERYCEVVATRLSQGLLI